MRSHRPHKTLERAAGAALVLAALAALCGAGGCAAPREVQAGQAARALAYQSYLRNDAELDNLVLGWWRTARGRQIRAAALAGLTSGAAKFGKARAALDKDGTPTGEPVISLEAAEAVALAEAALDQTAKANAGTRRIEALLATLRARNTRTFSQGQELSAALDAYMNAGIDEAAAKQFAELLGTVIDQHIGPAPPAAP